MTVSAPPSGRLNALASDGAYLWAVSGEDGAGALWRSRNASVWTEIQRFAEMPISVAAVAGGVFVGTYSEDGGTLWGPPVLPPPGAPATTFEDRNPNPAATGETTVATTEIERLVSGEAETNGLGRLRTVFQRLAGNSDPALGRQLAALYPKVAIEGRVRMFTDERVLSADLARWYMLGAMAVNGHGRVPLDLLAMPFSARQNRAEKYFDLPVAAIATVGWIGQDDAETIAALIRRLDQEQDPKWLQTDIAAALAALTGQSFGRDVAGWLAWWNSR